jgi:biotin--protein ligase
MSQALVYLDEGVCRQSAEALAQQLEEILDPSIAVIKVDSFYLKTEAWENRTVALVMGGGVCSIWDERLGTEGIDKIRRYVHQGGNYIGICAGAYFACKETRFEIGLSSIEKKRDLSFFPGKAIGPLVQTDEPLSLSAARAAKVYFDGEEEGSLYYQGGCFFEAEREDPEVEIMGRFRKLSPHKAAAVYCRAGRGGAFLCGLHPEFKWSASLSAKADRVYAKLVRKLSPHETFRQNVWKAAGRKLSLPMKFKP